MRGPRAAIAAITLGLCAASDARAQTVGTFDWQALNLASIDAVPRTISQTSGTITTTLTWTARTDGGMAPYPGIADYLFYYQNTYGGVTNGGLIAFDNDAFDLDDQIEAEFRFSAPVNGLAFSLGDVDQGGFDDFIVIEYDTGDGVWRNLVSGSQAARTYDQTIVTLPAGPDDAGNPVAVGVDDETYGPGFEGLASDGTTQGLISLDFGLVTVSAVRITYFTADDSPTGAAPDPGVQIVAISDLSFVSADPSADLSLAKAVNDPSPALGDVVTFTVTASNAGPAAASAEVTDALPPGLTYVGHAGPGAYDPATGIWALGTLAANADATLTIDARVDTTDPVTNIAEVSASSVADPDSTPDNRTSAPSEDDTARAVIGATASSGTAPSLSCASPPVFDWDANPWASGSALSKSYTVSGTPLSVTVGGDTSGLVNGTPLTNTYDANTGTGNTGGLATPEQSLYLYANQVARDDAVTVTITLGQPGTGVSGAQFAVFDVDTSLPGSDQFEDLLIVEGFLGGAPVTPTYTTSSANASNGFSVLGTAGSGSTSNAGNVTATFAQAVDTILVTYGNGPGANAAPGNQAISIHDIAFCPALPASLTASKRLVADAGYNLPGAPVDYEIEVTNTGGGSADAGSVLIVDALPDDVELFLGDIAGAGSGPVLFDEVSTGLGWDGDNVRVAATPPSAFADCQVPAGAGYDATARFLCIRPDGAMRAGTPPPRFTVRFRTRIR